MPVLQLSNDALDVVLGDIVPPDRRGKILVDGAFQTGSAVRVTIYEKVGISRVERFDEQQRRKLTIVAAMVTYNRTVCPPYNNFSFTVWQ